MAMAMAVQVDRGFSIREHVAKIRSIDIGKCRPFDGQALPTMDVRKFRWWYDEAAEALAAAPPLVRPKTPKKKKRSIVELFAISPQITAVGGETIGSDDEMEGLADVQTREEERFEEISGGQGLYYADLAALSKREEKESTFQLNNCRGQKRKKMKNKVEEEKTNLQIKISGAHKEKTRKPKINSSLSISQLLQEVKRKKMLRKSLKLSFQTKHKKKKKKKFPSSILSEENNLKVSPKSKTKSFTVQSILKKQDNTSPLKKHVTFSSKDDIFGREDSSSSPVEFLLVRNAGCPVTEEPESVKDSDIGAEEPGITTVFNELGIEKEKENCQRHCVDLNKMLDSSDTCIDIHDDSARERPELMVEITREPSSSCLIDKDQVSHADPSGNLPRTSICNRDIISVSSSTGSNKSTSADTRLNTDCISNMCFPEEFIGLPLNSQGELAINPKSNLIPNSSELFKRNEMLSGPSGGVLFPGSVPVPAPAPLPRPIGTASANQTDVIIRPLYFKDKFGTEHYYAPLMPVRPGFGFMQLPGFERMEIQSYDPLLDHTSQPTNIHQIQKNNAEPTVRLMGKNVSVGRSSKDCMVLNNSNVWIDEGNVTLNGDEFHFSRERKQGTNFSVASRFNEPRGQVYSHSGITFSNGYGAQPAPNLNPVFTNYNSFGYKKPAINQQVLLNSTHCKHSQSRSISFASSSYQGEVPRWIQNPRSKTHKPSFPSYVNPTTKEKQPRMVSGNRPNLSSPYPGTIISFPAYNPASSDSHSNSCISIPPLNSTLIPPYMTTRTNFASKNNDKVQTKSKFHLLRPSGHVNQNNKRPLEREDEPARPPRKRPFQSDLGVITKTTGPGTIVRSEETLDFGMRVGKPAGIQVANTKLNELGTGRISGPGSGFVVRSGPVKLSAGARHVLTPDPNLDQVNPKPIHSMMPLIGGASLSQKSTEEIYRF